MSTVTRRKRWSTINIVALVLGFIVWWPIGLAVLAYILWGGDIERTVQDEIRDIRDRVTTPNTDNSAFNEYKTATMRKLEEQKRKLDDEQAAFGDFMDRLRRSRDKDEFDRFMSERSKA